MANKGRAKVLDKAIFDDFVANSAETNQGDLLTLVACLGFYAGLRVGTIAALELDDVIDKQGNVKETAYIDGAKMKGGKAYTAYFNHPRLVSAILKYINDSRRPTKVRNLLITRKNTPYSAKSLSALIEKKWKDYGYQGYSAHSFRRSYASSIIEKGGDITLLRTLMNHSSITTTAIYVSNDPKTLQRMVASLD